MIYGKNLFEGDNALINDRSIRTFSLNESVNYSESKADLEKKLKDVGVFENEHLLALLYGDVNIQEFANYLSFTKSGIDTLMNEAFNQTKYSTVDLIQDYTNYPLGVALKKATQLLVESEKYIEPTIFGQDHGNKADSFINILYTTILRDSYVPSMQFPTFGVKNQGKFPTCTAFAATASNEYIKSKYGLSESYLYCNTKASDNYKQPETTLEWTCRTLNLVGQCSVRYYTYEGNSTNVCTDAVINKILSETEAPINKAAIVKFNPADTTNLMKAIENGAFPMISIRIFPSFYNSWTKLTGYVGLNLPWENEIGGHAICLTGYLRDQNWPGGGAFVFKNSWGKDWAKESAYSEGFGIIPFEYLRKHCLEAFVAL